MKLNNTMKSILTVGAVALPALMFVNCGAEETFDCAKVCNRYQECFDSDYDVEACTDRCDDTDDVNDADECESCIDGLSCTESFTCTAECASIVP